jgi:hypothetical protein
MFKASCWGGHGIFRIQSSWGGHGKISPSDQFMLKAQVCPEFFKFNNPTKL